MNAAAKHQPDLLERPASLLVPTWTKTGLALLYDEHTSNTYDVRLKLTKDLLIIQKQDVVCASGIESHLNHRTVVLRRQATGGLGLSIKGGAEHKVPVVISKIFKDQVADQTGKLFIGDAVLQVNGINVEKCTHEEVVHLLRTAGDEVSITVRYLREAPAFLKLPLGSPGPSSDHSSRASSPLFDSGLHLNGNSSNTAPSSPSSPSANEPKYEKRWLDAVTLPLFMARISRRKAGTDKLRSNSFEVIALDGVCTHVLQFCTAGESTDWLQAISTNINDLTQDSIKTVNKYCSADDQVDCPHGLGVRADSRRRCRQRRRRRSLLQIPGAQRISSAYLQDSTYWTQAEASFHLCEVLFKVHKLWIAEDCWIQTKLYMGLQQDGELRDSEPFCFSVLLGHGQSFCFSVELGSDLVLWEKAFQRAVFMEVQRVRSKSYMCSSQGKILCFTIDFESGFSCSDTLSKKIIWKYKFSQLKGSSDDGKTRVKLLFQNSENKQIEMKELEFANLTAVLHCIHSFIAAKVATVDPVFVSNQSLTQKYMCSS
ncbi:gamma-2-syntrophin [Danio rerio]|uniref:Gamma-2-syntrophin n=1 Tax=Danio rerio TaxID=7955 RepID=A0A0R4IAT6_DANRE|nr:gamma-2-syntrophin [Danio rerio]|eukprot:NP_001119899.1 gamma-2-syntrophin [Danio rerio]